MILTIYCSGLIATLLFLGWLQYRGCVFWDYIPISTFLLTGIFWPVFWLHVLLEKIDPQ